MVIPWYTGAISNPSDLKNYFYASFNTHQFSVVEVLVFLDFCSTYPTSLGINFMDLDLYKVINENVSGGSNIIDGIYKQTAWLINDPGIHVTKIIIIQVT